MSGYPYLKKPSMEYFETLPDYSPDIRIYSYDITLTRSVNFVYPRSSSAAVCPRSLLHPPAPVGEKLELKSVL